MQDELKLALEKLAEQNAHSTQSSRQIEQAVRVILSAIGENPDREGLQETPKRVAKMFMEIYAGVNKTNDQISQELLKVFKDDETDDAEKFGDMVIIKDIPFYSTCEHHLVPFFGKAHVGYIPSGYVIGLSKIARLVDIVAKRPQLQERIGKDVLDILVKMMDPVGVMVVIEAEHLCMSMRGIKKPGTKTVTSAAWGAFKYDPATRSEFMNLINRG
jgi:GTP cyclohydrolase I